MEEMAAFVSARLDEDERFVRVMSEAGERKAEEATPGDLADAYSLMMTMMNSAAVRQEIARWEETPVAPPTTAQRILADIAAKRNRITMMTEAHAVLDRLAADDSAGITEQAMALGSARAATVAVKYDAQLWSAHPGFDPKWKP